MANISLIENPVPWPDRAKCAVAITFDLDVDSILHIHRPETADTFVSTQSALRYGAEIAIPRICRIFKDLGLKQTFFVPGWCVERYPRTLEQIVSGGHEIGHHGYLHESPNAQSAKDEQYWFERALKSYDMCLGIKPKGYRAPLNEFSKYTLGYLLDAEFEYDSSLMGDDLPYLLEMDERSGAIFEVPQWIVNDDWPHFMHSWDLGYQMPISSPQRAMEVFLSEFDVMWEDGGFWMSVWHPMLTGRPSRMRMLIEMIEYMQNKGSIWFCTLWEMVDHVKACIESGLWKPRKCQLPFDKSPIAELSRPV